MADFEDEYARQHQNAVRAGAAGRNGEVRPIVSYLKFTDVDSAMSKGMKKAMKTKETKKPEAKKSLLSKPKKKAKSSEGSKTELPRKSALQKKMQDIGWKKYERYIEERWGS